MTDQEAPQSDTPGSREPVVTYEAADRGAVCCLGCQAWLLILGGIGLVVWYLFGQGVWAAIAGAILVMGGIALSRFLARGRNRWEVSFDRQRRVVSITSCVSRTTQVREIPFAQISAIELREITRNVSTGTDVPYHLPVFGLESGEEVALDERLSVKDPERAREVLEEIRGLLSESGSSQETDQDDSTSER